MDIVLYGEVKTLYSAGVKASTAAGIMGSDEEIDVITDALNTARFYESMQDDQAHEVVEQ